MSLAHNLLQQKQKKEEKKSIGTLSNFLKLPRPLSLLFTHADTETPITAAAAHNPGTSGHTTKAQN